MYSIYDSILAKLNLLISFVKNSLNANYLLTTLTYLSMFIVVMTLMSPVYKLVMTLIGNLIGKKKEKSSSHRIYKKIDSSNCSVCKSSSKSSSSSSKLHKSIKKKKCKVKLNKKKINKTLRQFKLN
jgi:hypothetical protein